MPVPDFQSLMLPLLRIAADGEEHSLAEARDVLASQFKLTDAERQERLPSGRQFRFANRVAWAKVYLQQAGLVESAQRGHFGLTERGRGVLKQPPEKIDIKFLSQFTEFQAFRNRQDPSPETDTARSSQTEEQSPEEALEAAYLKMRAGLAAEVLVRVKSNSPQFFERLVVELLVKMGYGGSRRDAGKAIGKSGDEGIDGIINEDRLGLDTIYIQAKRWGDNQSIGRPEIQRFVGALQGKHAKKGVFITTGNFSPDATAYAERIDPKVVLIDGGKLAELMIDFEVGIAAGRSYDVKHLDSDYFEETEEP
jgi:restriction system protein